MGPEVETSTARFSSNHRKELNKDKLAREAKGHSRNFSAIRGLSGLN
jgi:hypothetical protein